MDENEKKLRAHVSLIQDVFMKAEDRFFTTMEIMEKTKEAPWSEFDYIAPALERSVQYGYLEHDPMYGYCRKGKKDMLRSMMSKPKMSRAEFDMLTFAEQKEHCKNGGIVV